VPRRCQKVEQDLAREEQRVQGMADEQGVGASWSAAAGRTSQRGAGGKGAGAQPAGFSAVQECFIFISAAKFLETIRIFVAISAPSRCHLLQDFRLGVVDDPSP